MYNWYTYHNILFVNLHIWYYLLSLKVFPQISDYRFLTEQIVIHTNVKKLYNHYCFCLKSTILRHNLHTVNCIIKLYSLLHFDSYVHRQSISTIKIHTISITNKRFLRPLCNSSFICSHPGNWWSAFCSSNLVFIF